MLALLVIAAILTVYWHSFSRLIGLWSSSDYEYGWLVYPVSAYLLIRNRHKLADVHWRTSVAGTLLAGVIVLSWIAARAAGVQVVEFAVATFLIFAVYWALAGADAARAAAFPLLLLLAAVPAADFVVQPLMAITAAIASACLSIFGIPALRDGQFFVLPGGSFEVADVCSGLRYLLAGTMAALAYAYVTYSSTRKRLLFIVVTAVVLVITNGIRAFIVMAVASATEMKVLGGRDHVLFGMVLFALVFIVLIWFGEAYADNRDDSSARPAGPDRRTGRDLSTAAMAATLLVVLAGPMFDVAMENRGSAQVVDLPLPTFPGCTLSGGWAPDELPAFRAADLEKHATYSCRDYSIGVFVASYGEQRQGRELINWANRVWPDEWRRYTRESIVPWRTANGSIDVREVLVRDPEGWWLTWYWYQVGPSTVGSKFRVKLLETLEVMTLKPIESSIVVISVFGGGQDNEEELREQIAAPAARLMAWNVERVTAGESR